MPALSANPKERDRLARRYAIGRTMSIEKRWTQTDITALRGRLEGGESAAEICEALERSAEDVLQMMSRLSLRVRP